MESTTGYRFHDPVLAQMALAAAAVGARMEVATTDLPLLDQLRAKRDKAIDDFDTFRSARLKVEDEFRARGASADNKPTDDETRAFNEATTAFEAECDQRDAEIKSLKRRCRDEKTISERRAQAALAAAGTGTAVVRSSPLTYRWDNARRRDGQVPVSYWLDLAATGVRGINLQSTSRDAAQERLNRHAQEMDIELGKRMQAKASQTIKEMERMLEKEGLEAANPFKRSSAPTHGFCRDRRSAFEMRIEPNLTQGQGGYFV